MINTRYKDQYGNTEKLDMVGNHFINGKCVNPKSWKDTSIGDTFDPTGLEEYNLADELNITGHVSEFSYYDHDEKKTVFVDTRINN